MNPKQMAVDEKYFDAVAGKALLGDYEIVERRNGEVLLRRRALPGPAENRAMQTAPIAKRGPARKHTRAKR